ncbi:reverse transcriptase domain-containing protein [Tanacetum coccineum]
MNVSSISEIIKPTFEGLLKRACKQISYLTTPIRRKNPRNPYLICDICGGAHKADECDQNKPPEQVCLSGRDIYDDPSLLRFYHNDDISPWGNNQRKKECEEGPKWVVKSKFEDELSGFMLEKSFHTKGLGELLDQHHKKMHEQFSQILTTIEKSKTPTSTPDASTFAITTRSGTSTYDPPYPTPPRPTTINHTERTVEEGVPESQEPTVRNSKKAASSVKLSEECSVVIQRSLPQKVENSGSFIVPCLIGPLAVKHALAELGESINLMPYSLFLRLGISELKPTWMSVELANRSVKYPFGVCENPLVKINKFIFSVDFVVLEMDEDDPVPIILGRPFLATTRAVINVHEGKLSLRVRSEIVTFNIGKSIRSKYSRDNYLYCVDHTAKLDREQWVDTVDHDGKWIEAEEVRDPKEAQFDIEIRDKKGIENLAANHLSRLENPGLGKLTRAAIRDLFPEEQLMKISDKSNEHWYADYANYLASRVLPFRSTRPFPSSNGNKYILVAIDYVSTWVEARAFPSSDAQNVVKFQKKYGVVHRFSTAYHPQTSGQVENTNRAIKRVLEKTIGNNRKEWSHKLDDALWAFQTRMSIQLANRSVKYPLGVWYFRIPIALEDQEKTTFTCPYGIFAYKRMPFGPCNALAIFQRCVMAIFHELIEDSMEVFMDDFSVFGSSFDHCLENLEKMLKRCEETFVLNWEKCHFMVKERIILGHKVFGSGIEAEGRFLHINELDELDELRLDAYESSISYKERTKRWHDNKSKHQQNMKDGDKDMKNEPIELCDMDGNEFIVNKQCVKPYQKDVLDFDGNDDAKLEGEGEVTFTGRYNRTVKDIDWFMGTTAVSSFEYLHYELPEDVVSIIFGIILELQHDDCLV